MPEKGFKLEVLPLFSGIPSMETPAESTLVKAAEKLTGFTASSVAFGTEAPYLTEMGIETIVLGPGDIAQAHQADEYLDIERIQPTVELLKKLIDKFCIQS